MVGVGRRSPEVQLQRVARGDALQHGPSLRPAIRTEVVAAFDEERDPDTITPVGWQAKQMLLTHR